MTALTQKAIADHKLYTKEKDRTKNFFALGLVSWIYTRPLEPTLEWIGKKFTKSADIAEANTRVLKAGHAFGETAEFFEEAYTVEPAEMAPGLYRAMTGNRALAWGLLAAAERSKVPLVYGAYPITPASSVLEELAMHKRFRIRTIQAEDEIAAVTAAIGASFGGAIGITCSSGPGIAPKYMVPVIVLSDGFLANGSEPWLIPDPTTLPPIDIQFRTEPEGFFAYLRDPATLSRPWVRPGTPGLEHRIGGIEKQDVTGNISYDADNHDLMVRTRAEKVRRVAQEIPPTTINGPATGDVLVVGWGGTYGAITAAVERAQTEGK